MDADWYEDPLGRFDGRFFDGQAWTDQVSVDGAPAIDPDFPAIAATFESSASAVEPLEPAAPRRATLTAESPARTVAVLDESVVSPSATAPSNGSLKGMMLAALAAAALVIGFVLLRGNTELDPVDEDRVADLESGGLASDAGVDQAEDLSSDAVDASTGAAAGETFDESEAVTVGALSIVNGAVVLDELEAWHVLYTVDRGIELPSNAGCWFGELGDAAVQVAQCGPVGGGGEGEFLFDLVPLLFDEDASGGYVATSVIDGVTPNAVLANTLRLVGHSGSASPPLTIEARGDRDAGAN